ncbi:MAG TPA: serine hydrolase domain-containing protein [Gemmatimonadaceae bacterium]
MTRLHAPGIIARSLVAGTAVLIVVATRDGRSAAPRPAEAHEMVPRAAHALRYLIPTAAFSGAPASLYTLEERMGYYGVPGVSIAIINEGRIESVIAAGQRDASMGTPADTTTLFEAGSLSQPIAALTALRLAERGRLDLDADVNRYLEQWTLPPSRFTLAHKVTPRRILSHTAGLTGWELPTFAPGAPVPTLPELLSGSRRAGTLPLRNDTIPGRRWLYSAGGYATLQQLLEDITDTPFPTLARRLTLTPLGMARTRFEYPLPPEHLTNMAAAHDALGRPMPIPRHVHPATAATGLWTTAADLARLAVAIQRSARGDASAPFSMGIASQLLTPDTALGLFGHRWGLGLAIAGRGPTERFTHAGRDDGFRSHLVAFRHTGQGAVVLTNGQRGDALIQEILRAIATEYRWPALQPVEVDTVPTDSATAFPLAGRYVNYVSGGDTAFVTLVWKNGRLGGVIANEVRALWAQADGRFTDPLTSDTFWAEYDELGHVVALGHVNLWQESIPRRLERAP